MSRLRFSLSSDQLELLLSFEESKGLTLLAESIGRDPSVISRGLQRIAEEHPVLVKVRGRWELTPLGQQLNEITRGFIASQQKLFPVDLKKKNPEKISISEKSILILINAQAGLWNPTQESRNNSDAEDNILKLLQFWRKSKKPIIHVKHISENPSSIFFKSSAGSEFLPMLAPQAGEEIIEKTKSSAFAGTLLEERLKVLEPDHIVLVGFTANECIDSAAKDAAVLGFTPMVVGDATATFDIRGVDGKLIKAERLHKLTLANINAYSAKVIQTIDILS